MYHVELISKYGKLFNRHYKLSQLKTAQLFGKSLSRFYQRPVLIYHD